MFGYVKTDFPNMYVKDTVLYKAMYCGLCKGIGKTCGQKARLVLNYDLAFLSVLLHNLWDKDVKIEKQRCIIHHIAKRPVAVPDELTYRIASLNVILAYYKVSDDVLDDGKGRLRKAFLSKAYKKAKKKEPELDAIVKKRYSDLVAYEKTQGDSIDLAADFFGNMMSESVSVLASDKMTEDLSLLAYNLGKWIYLIDALDDFDKDIKKKNYNVLKNAYPDIKDKQTLINEKKDDLILIFGALLNDISERAKNLKYKFNHDLIDNVLLSGLKIQTKKIMENTKCKNTSKF